MHPIDGLIGRPWFGADGDSIDLCTRTKLRSTSGESLIGNCASARQLGESRGLFGMRAERAALQADAVDAAVGDQPILGLGIFLVENMIAEREKDWPALDT